MSSRHLRLIALENRIAPATIQWDGGPTGNGTNWLDPVNWKGDVAPGATDTAQLDATGTNPTITIGGAASAQLIVCTRPLSILAGGSLSVGKGSSLLTSVGLNGGTLDLQNGAVISSTNFQGTGTLTIAAGRTVTLALCTSDASVSVSGTLLVGSEFIVNAALTINSGGIVRVSGDGTTTSLNIHGGLTNNGLLELTSASSGQKALVDISGGSLTNSATGTIAARIGLGGPREIHLNSAANQLINQGAILVEGGLNVTRSGTGQLVTNSGTISVNPGQTLNLDASLDFKSGTMVGGGSAIFNAVQLSNNLTPGLASVSVSGLTGTGKLSITAATIVTARSASSLLAPFDNSGLLVIRGSCSIGTGFTSKPGSTIRVEGEPVSGSANLHMTAAFTNHGTIELTSATSANNATLTIDSGSLTNASDGSIKVQNGVGGSRFLNVMFAGGLTNQGLLSIKGTDLFFTGQPLVNTGILDVGSEATLSTTVTVTNNSPGVIIGSGTIKSGGLSGTGEIVPDGSLAINNSSNFGGALTFGLDNKSTFDSLQVQGSVTLAGPLNVLVNYSAQVGDEFLILENDGSDTISGKFSNLSAQGTITVGTRVFQVNDHAGTGNDISIKVSSIGTAAPSAVIQVNNGTTQRSLVTAFQVIFSEDVTFPDGVEAAFTLTRTGPGNPLGNVLLDIIGAGINYDISFNDPIFAPGLTKSLIDGNYSLTLLASKIHGSGG